MSSAPSSNPPSFLSEKLATNLADTRGRIETAALRHGRDSSSVTLLAVSKQQPVEAIQAAAALGQRDFGESYLQEAISKIAEVDNAALSWHFIGQLQSNKTRPV